jgi:AraC-like DNA-binding protein
MQIQKIPLHSDLYKWIDSCVSVESFNFSDLFSEIVGFPEATPELIILFRGSLNVQYNSTHYNITKSCFFTYIDRPILATPSDHIQFIRLTFKPLGVFPLAQLTHHHPSELTKLPVIDAQTVFGNDFTLLEQELSEANLPHASKLLSGFLLNRLLLSPPKSKESALLNLQTSACHYDVDELCSYFHVSPRTLQRWFAQNLDVSPKYYLRLLRFKRIIQVMSSGHTINYSQLAADFGFYDQNHLIKEVKHFTAHSPSQLDTTPYFSKLIAPQHT